MILNAIKWIGKTILKAVATIVIFSLVVGFFIAGISSNFKEKPVTIKPQSYLVLEFPRGIPEVSKPVFKFPYGFRIDSVPLYDVLKAIDSAAEDKKINAIVLKLDKWRGVYSEHADEIKEKLKKFKSTGKRVYAYGTNINNGNYNIASVADMIAMPPSRSAFFNLTGYYRNIPYYKKLADKLGIKMNVIHIGDFKAFGENYNKEFMSESFRGELTKIYDHKYENWITEISELRSLSRETVETELFNGKFAQITPEKALEYNLIDTTAYYSEFISDIDKLNGIKSNTVSVDLYAKASVKGDALKTAAKSDRIAVIFAEGEIRMETVGDSPFGNESAITPSNIAKDIDKIASDKTVKGVVLRVNSPGGSALASDLIMRKIEELKLLKPVVISMGPVAASGGYYISCRGSKIFAEKNTITGSIGVVSIFPNIKDMTEKIGINYESVKKGKYSDLYDFTKEVDRDDLSLIKRRMTDVYEEFRDNVSQGRGIEVDALEEIAQGKIWTGEQAKEIGLVDEVGGLSDAVTSAAELAEISDYRVITLPEQKNFMETLQEINLQTVYNQFNTNSKYLAEIADLYNRVNFYSTEPLTLLPVKVD